MTLDEYNAFCASLPHTTTVVQWGGAHVWKVAGKVFAVGGWTKDGEPLGITFKVSEIGFEVWKEEPGCRPAPYLASRGMKWIQRVTDETMDDDGLRDALTESHRLVSLKLTKKLQKELGLNQPKGDADA